LKQENAMSLDAIRQALPAHAKDIKLNLSNVVEDGVLSEQQRYGTLVAAALASRNGAVIVAAEAEAAQHLSAEALTAVKAAAAVMAMNNIYYRFVHLASAPEYGTMRAGLRMNVIGNPGVDRADFELWSLAVSAINGCGMCIDAHEKELRKAGIRPEQVQAAVKIAAVVHAAAAVLDGEQAVSGGLERAA
jgi:alkyl hydroperoxide reductase subunit D